MATVLQHPPPPYRKGHTTGWTAEEINFDLAFVKVGERDALSPDAAYRMVRARQEIMHLCRVPRNKGGFGVEEGTHAWDWLEYLDSRGGKTIELLKRRVTEQIIRHPEGNFAAFRELNAERRLLFGFGQRGPEDDRHSQQYFILVIHA